VPCGKKRPKRGPDAEIPEIKKVAGRKRDKNAEKKSPGGPARVQIRKRGTGTTKAQRRSVHCH